MQYSQEYLDNLIAEVENEFARVVSDQTLAKSEEDVVVVAKPAIVEVEGDKVDLEKSIETAQSVNAELNNDIELNYDEEDYKSMDELYGSMTKSEAEAHFQALSKVLNVVEVSDEDKLTKSSSDEFIVSLKNERDLVKKENEQLKKSIENLVSVLKNTKLTEVVAPKRKGITTIHELGIIQKSEANVVNDGNTIDVSQLSREQVKAKLNEVIKTQDLTKSERDSINAYCLNRVGIDAIQHLINK